MCACAYIYYLLSLSLSLSIYIYIIYEKKHFVFLNTDIEVDLWV